MNDYERVKNMDDGRWTNVLKCDIFKNVTELGELEEHARYTRMNATLQKEKKQIRNLKKFINKYEPIMNEANGHYVDKILAVTKDRKLMERYRNSHPNEIKASMQRSIHNINQEANVLMTQINEKIEKFKEMQSSLCKQLNEQTPSIEKLKQILGKTADLEKKILLVDLNIRKIETEVDSNKQDLNIYDSYLKQLDDEVALMSKNLVKELEISADIKAGMANYVTSYDNEKRESEKSAIKAYSHMDKLNAIIHLLEQSRNSFLEDNTTTEKEKQFLAQLPWTLDSVDDISEDISKGSKTSSITLDLPDNKDEWYNKMLEFGIMYFVDQDEPLKFLDNLKNDKFSSSINYKFPANVVDYVSLNNTSITTDELAINYLLKTTQFNTAEDLIKSVENTKNDMIKLNKFNALRKSLWELLIKKNTNIQETADYLNLMTNEDIEYNKQIDVLKSFIDGQQTEISDLDKTKNHYLVLLNDLYFYMLNVQNIFKQVDFSVENTKRTSNINVPSQDTLKTSDNELTILIQELKSVINTVDKKIQRCLLIVQDEFSPDKLNLAHALYVFKNQERIQDAIMKKKIELDNISKRKVESEKPSISDSVLTRQDMKRLADEIVKDFNEKDKDCSKNKRKLLSRRHET